MNDREWEIARKWLDKASDIEMHVAEYDPDERDLSEVHMLQIEAETLRKCANDLLRREPKPAEEEINF